MANPHRGERSILVNDGSGKEKKLSLRYDLTDWAEIEEEFDMNSLEEIEKIFHDGVQARKILKLAYFGLRHHEEIEDPSDCRIDIGSFIAAFSAISMDSLTVDMDELDIPEEYREEVEEQIEAAKKKKLEEKAKEKAGS